MSRPRPAVVTTIPLRDGPWQAVIFDGPVGCEGIHNGRRCQRQPGARHRWLSTVDGRVVCGVCRWETTGRVPERQEPAPVRDESLGEQTMIELP